MVSIPWGVLCRSTEVVERRGRMVIPRLPHVTGMADVGGAQVCQVEGSGTRSLTGHATDPCFFTVRVLPPQFFGGGNGPFSLHSDTRRV